MEAEAAVRGRRGAERSEASLKIVGVKKGCPDPIEKTIRRVCGLKIKKHRAEGEEGSG